MGLLSFLGLGKELAAPIEAVGNLYTKQKDVLSSEAQIVDSVAKVDVATSSVNAASENSDVKTWRDRCGDICWIALGWSYAIKPILMFTFLSFGINLPNIADHTSDLIPLVYGMLGLGVLHVIDGFRNK